MDNNVENLKSILLPRANTKNRILIASNKKKKFSFSNIARDLHRVIPNSIISFNITKNYFYHELKNYILTKKNVSIFYLNYKKKDSYVLISNTFHCITYQLLLYSVFTCSDFRFFGNCLKWSNSILIFDEYFTKRPHLIVLRTLLVEIFTSKSKNKLSEPIIDNVVSFVCDKSKILLKIYQIKYIKNSNIYKKSKNLVLLEIGPRITMIPLKAWSNLTDDKRIIFNLKSNYTI